MGSFCGISMSDGASVRRVGSWAMAAVLAMMLVMGQAACAERRGAAPSVHKGRIDCRNWDIMTGGLLDLSGTWHFHWKELRDSADIPSTGVTRSGSYSVVPGFWNYLLSDDAPIGGVGFGTYRLDILLDERWKEGHGPALALMIPDIGTAYRLYINGILRCSGGVVGTSAATSRPAYWPAVVTVHPTGDRVEVIVQVSNFHHRKGGLWNRILLGPEEQVRSRREINLAVSLFLFGSIFIMGCYHIILFSFRRKDRAHLYFGLFCLLIALRTIFTGEYIILRMVPGMPWGLGLAIEYITVYLGATLFFMYFQSLFPRFFSEAVLRFMQALGGIFTAAVLLAPPSLYTYTMFPFQVLTVGVCLYGVVAMYRALRRGAGGAIPFTVGFTILFITVVNDFVHNNLVIPTGYLVPLGLLIFIGSQAYILSARFSHAFSSVEALSEELVIKNSRLQDLDRLKDELIANISHELKTPLHGMIGLAEAVLEGEPSGDQGRRSMLTLIIASGRRLSGMVNDLLDLSRLRNHDLALDLKPVDISSLTDVTIALTQPMLKGNRVLLINAIDPAVPAVMADENRLQQIMLNIIGNAIKFTERGEIKVTAEVVEDAGAGTMVRVSVIDTGIGIDPTMLERVFEPFEQIDSSATRARGGAGLGLTIIRQLVALHGGTVTLASEPGRGTVCSFSLAAADADEDEGEKATVPLILPLSHDQGHTDRIYCTRGAEPRGHILAADDDPVNCRVLEHYLGQAGYHIRTVNDGGAVIDALSERDYDLVILDMMMPGMSGLETCNRLRRHYTAANLPVLILTARSGAGDIVAGFEAGANDFLAKPVRREELLARVNNLVSLKKAVIEHGESRYKLLQERMNPHFLFNALNTVHSLVRRDPAAADEAVIKLAHNYRFLIDQSFRNLIPFDEEWSFTRNYLDLEELRFRDTLSVAMSLSGDSAGVMIPPLTLQPLVENALKHGLRPKKGPGAVMVMAVIDDGLVRVTVLDTGVGLGSHDLMTRSLGNIIKRLSYHFDDAGISIANRDDGVNGVRVQLNYRWALDGVRGAAGA